MKTSFVIDRSKWRCGGRSHVMLPQGREKALRGEGATELLNREGFMCCLGQIAEQCGVPRSTLRAVKCPCDIPTTEDQPIRRMLVHNGFADPYGTSIDPGMTEFADQAVGINDNPELTDTQRERSLERLAEKYGLRIEFVGEYVC